MQRLNGKRLIKYAGNAVTVLSIAFIIKAAISLDIDLSIFRNKVTFAVIFMISMLVMGAAVLIIACGWMMILSVLSGKRVRYIDAAGIYAKANMGKYLPGNVMHYIERNLFAGSLGLSQKAVLLSTLTEIMGLVCVCAVFGTLTAGRRLSQVLKLILEWKYRIAAAVLVGVILLCILLLQKKRFKIFSAISWKLLIKAFTEALPTYFLFVISGGFTLMLIFGAADASNMTLHVILVILSAYTISWVTGFIVPGSPGGIGVREFVLLFLLRDEYTESIILTCILVHRFISILGDILAYLITRLMVWYCKTKFH